MRAALALAVALALVLAALWLGWIVSLALRGIL